MRYAPIGFAAVLAACGDNRVPLGDANPPPLDAPAIDAPPIDASSGTPDLTLIAADMDGTAVITQDTFTGVSCEVLEECVGGPGGRRLLRFDTVTANLGTGDLVLGDPPAAGVSDDVFEWSSCHGHHHVSGYASYELRDDNGFVVGGHKQAFCLQDLKRVVPGAPSQGFGCSHQGMSVGWADVYSRALPCQWIDITDVPSGTYTLRVEVNPSGTLPDGDPTNNVYTAVVAI